MNYKEIIEDILKNKSKSKLCEELGISQYYVDKVLHGEEVPEQVKTNIIELVAHENGDEELIEITQNEETFILDSPIDTFFDKVNRISYLNYVLNSTKANRNHYWKQILTKNGTTTEEQKADQLERMVKAILAGNWKVIDEELPYMIKLSSGHYLTKMIDGSIGWSLVQNANTIISNSRDDLVSKYPEYEHFIVQEAYDVVNFKPQGEKSTRFIPTHKKKGFVIKNNARKDY